MATIRKLRGRWQAQVRRRGMKPRCKSFDSKQEAEKWARDLEAQVDRFDAAPDTKILESTTLGQLLERYQREILPTKRGSIQEIQRIDVLRRHDLAYRTLIGLSQQDIASFRDERLHSVAPSTTVRELPILSCQSAANIVAACLFCNTTRHKAKHPVDAATHAAVVRSRLEKGR